MDCMLAHNAFHSASKSVKERNQIHRLEYQPRMEKSGLDFSVSVLIADIELAAGQRITQTIFASTNDLYDQIDFGIKHLAHAGYLAAEKFRDMYREHQIIGFNAPE